MLTPDVTETIRAGHFAEMLVGHTFRGTGTGLPVEHIEPDHVRIEGQRDRVSASVLAIPDEQERA